MLETPEFEGIPSLPPLDCMLSIEMNPSPCEKFKTFSAMGLELGRERARGSFSNFKKYIYPDCISQGMVEVGVKLTAALCIKTNQIM
jgi:hypothetical protein